jgi:hypothetical protein
MELSFKSMRISPLIWAQQIRDPSLYVIPYTSDLVLICFVIDLLLNKMYYTNNTEDTVTCCDMNGKVQWGFHNENVLDSPIGITTDKNNNIYVVGGGSYNVVVIFAMDKTIKYCYQTVTVFLDITTKSLQFPGHSLQL